MVDYFNQILFIESAGSKGSSLLVLHNGRAEHCWFNVSFSAFSQQLSHDAYRTTEGSGFWINFQRVTVVEAIPPSAAGEVALPLAMINPEIDPDVLQIKDRELKDAGRLICRHDKSQPFRGGTVVQFQPVNFKGSSVAVIPRLLIPLPFDVITALCERQHQPSIARPCVKFRQPVDPGPGSGRYPPLGKPESLA